MSHWALAAITASILALAFASPALAGEVTGASDNLRTGWYPEAAIDPGVVEAGHFGEAFKTHLQGQIYAQPLVANGTLLVATESNVVYGLDPFSGSVLWEKKFGIAVTAGEEPSDTIPCTDLQPTVGITSTPVIDTEKDLAYFTSTRYVSGNEGETGWYMNAIDLSNGEEARNFPVRIEGEAENLPGVKFEPVQALQRPSLLMMHGVVYAAFGSHCDNTPFEGWLVGVSSVGKVTAKFVAARSGASIWQSGGGLISDGEGRIIFTTGNAPNPEAEAFPLPGPGDEPQEGRLDDSVVRVEVQSDGTIKPRDFFAPFNVEFLDTSDFDLGSSAPLALPSGFGNVKHPKLLVQSGKYGDMYLLDREHLGGTDQGGGSGQGEGGNDATVQDVGNFGGVWAAGAAWPGDGGYVYLPSASEGRTDDDNGGSLQFFKYEEAGGEPRLSTHPATTAGGTERQFGFGSGGPIVTSKGLEPNSGLVWSTWCPHEEAEGERGCEGAELRAYKATPGSEEEGVEAIFGLKIGTATKFSRPDASKGHIYLANNEGVAYGFAAAEPASERETHEQEAATEREQHALLGREIAERELPKAEVPALPESKEPARPEGKAAPIDFVGPPGPPPPGTKSPNLTGLKLLASASKLGAHKRKLVVSFNLSASGQVLLVVYRKEISHHCKGHARSCVLWMATKIKLKTNAHAGANTATVSLGTLTAGNYRLAATPSATTGATGVTRNLPFETTRAAGPARR
jgi:hypothetical protein